MTLPNPKPKKTSITFYVLHIPVLAVIAVALMAYTAAVPGGKERLFSSVHLLDQKDLSFVLGDSDENEGEDEDMSEEERIAKEKELLRKKEMEKDRLKNMLREKQEKLSQYLKEKMMKEEDLKNKKALEKTNELNELNKRRTEEKIINEDGTYTIVLKEFSEGRTIILTKTFSAFGTLLSEERTEVEGNKLESNNVDKEKRMEKPELDEEKIKAKKELPPGLSNFPLYLNEEDGNVYVTTPKGDVKLGVMPESIMEKARLNNTSENVETIELEELEDATSESSDAFRFKVNTKKSAKLFGVFDVEIPATKYYSTENGDYLENKQTFLNRVLEALSF